MASEQKTIKRKLRIMSSGVLLKMEVGIRKDAWQRAWKYPAYLWLLRWVYAVKKTPEFGIRHIPAYPPQYTTDYEHCYFRLLNWERLGTDNIIRAIE